MATTISPLVSTRQFTFTQEDGFVSELSSVAIGRVFADSCDEGLTLVSHKTGAERVFSVKSETRDEEGGLLFLTLVEVCPRTGCMVPGGFQMTLFND